VQTNISTRHGQISTTTQEKITSKLEKLTRIYDRVNSAEVTIDLEQEDAPKVEITLSVIHGDGFVATVDPSNFNSGNLMGQIDKAVHKLETQLRKHKEKYITRRSSGRKTHEALESGEADTE